VDTNSVISAVDLFPTLSRLAGATMLGGSPADGEDIAPALFGKTVGRSKALYWEYGRNTNSFSYPGIAGNRSPNVAVRDGHWKLLVNADGTGAELYDLGRDPEETRNVISDQREVGDRLTRAALDWRKSLP
jgi:arylsulfatase A-like enzyme